MFRTCLPAGRYKENKKILLIPGPDLIFMAVLQGTLLLKYYWDINLIRVNRARAGLFILSKNIPPQAAKFNMFEYTSYFEKDVLKKRPYIKGMV